MVISTSRYRMCRLFGLLTKVEIIERIIVLGIAVVERITTGKMKYFCVTLCSLFLSLALTFVDAATIRGGPLSHVDTSSLSPLRQLQGDGMNDFRTLSCNVNIASATCITWSSTFGTSNSHSTRITIPCGQCVTMDHVGGDLVLLGGLDVVGKLVFPDGYNLNLLSTMIVVQGELQMTSSKAVDGIPNVKFTMFGDDSLLMFTPVDVNTNACKGVSTCSIGKKAIIVAGGKVTGTLPIVLVASEL
jgi:G8 domain